MKGILLRVGADTKNPGVLAPIFDDGSFEFIPIAEEEGTVLDEMTYGSLKGRHGEVLLADYLPEKYRNWIPHNDPEFITPSYGDPTSKKSSLKKLQKNDLLVFNAGLRAYNTDNYPRRANYIVGYFTVDRIVDFSKLTNKKHQEEWNLLQNNFHVGYRKEEDCFIIVGQKENSALFSKAILFSELRPRADGILTSAITKKMEKTLEIKGFVERRLRLIPESGCKNLLKIFDKYI